MNNLLRYLAPFADTDDLTLDGLVEAVNGALPQLMVDQPKGSVHARVDGRTIRYYTTRGLLPRPVGYAGGRARYGFGHLLRALAIKKLQADHHNLKVIKKTLTGLDDRAVGLQLGLASPEPTLTLVEASSDGQPVVGPPGASPKASEDRLSLELMPGGEVLVAKALLEDPEKRHALATSLEQLASWLRASLPPSKGETP